MNKDEIRNITSQIAGHRASNNATPTDLADESLHRLGLEDTDLDAINTELAQIFPRRGSRSSNKTGGPSKTDISIYIVEAVALVGVSTFLSDQEALDTNRFSSRLGIDKFPTSEFCQQLGGLILCASGPRAQQLLTTYRTCKATKDLVCACIPEEEMTLFSNPEALIEKASHISDTAETGADLLPIITDEAFLPGLGLTLIAARIALSKINKEDKQHLKEMHASVKLRKKLRKAVTNSSTTPIETSNILSKLQNKYWDPPPLSRRR